MAEELAPESNEGDAMTQKPAAPVICKLTLMFDEKGDLQLNTENMNLYVTIGVLRAATLLCDAKLSASRPALAIPVKPA